MNLADTALIQESGTVEVVHSGVSTTEYKISGTLPAVFDGIAAVFKKFNPIGYGTMVHTIIAQTDERYVVRMSRSNSCD